MSLLVTMATELSIIERGLFAAVGDRRPPARRVANLYYTYVVYGWLSDFYITIWYSGRPFTLFGNLINVMRVPEKYWIEGIPRLDLNRSNESIAQILGDSHEIQYCAAVVGIPYDIVGLIELLILAVV